MAVSCQPQGQRSRTVARILHKLGRATNGLLQPHELEEVDATSWDDLMAGFRALDNSANGACFSKGSSAYRGVNWHKAKGKWAARIRPKGGKQLNLGSFEEEAAAARAYDTAAAFLHGSAARLNFKDKTPPEPDADMLRRLRGQGRAHVRGGGRAPRAAGSPLSDKRCRTASKPSSSAVTASASGSSSEESREQEEGPGPSTSQKSECSSGAAAPPRRCARRSRAAPSPSSDASDTEEEGAGQEKAGPSFRTCRRAAPRKNSRRSQSPKVVTGDEAMPDAGSEDAMGAGCDADDEAAGDADMEQEEEEDELVVTKARVVASSGDVAEQVAAEEETGYHSSSSAYGSDLSWCTELEASEFLVSSGASESDGEGERQRAFVDRGIPHDMPDFVVKYTSRSGRVTRGMFLIRPQRILPLPDSPATGPHAAATAGATGLASAADAVPAAGRAADAAATAGATGPASAADAEAAAGPAPATAAATTVGATGPASLEDTVPAAGPAASAATCGAQGVAAAVVAAAPADDPAAAAAAGATGPASVTDAVTAADPAATAGAADAASSTEGVAGPASATAAATAAGPAAAAAAPGAQGMVAPAAATAVAPSAGPAAAAAAASSDVQGVAGLMSATGAAPAAGPAASSDAQGVAAPATAAAAAATPGVLQGKGVSLGLGPSSSPAAAAASGAATAGLDAAAAALDGQEDADKGAAPAPEVVKILVPAGAVHPWRFVINAGGSEDDADEWRDVLTEENPVMDAEGLPSQSLFERVVQEIHRLRYLAGNGRDETWRAEDWAPRAFNPDGSVRTLTPVEALLEEMPKIAEVVQREGIPVKEEYITRTEEWLGTIDYAGQSFLQAAQEILQPSAALEAVARLAGVARPEALSSEMITSVLETVKAGHQTPAEGAMEVDGEQEGYDALSARVDRLIVETHLGNHAEMQQAALGGGASRAQAQALSRLASLLKERYEALQKRQQAQQRLQAATPAKAAAAPSPPAGPDTPQQQQQQQQPAVASPLQTDSPGAFVIPEGEYSAADVVAMQVFVRELARPGASFAEAEAAAHAARAEAVAAAAGVAGQAAATVQKQQQLGAAEATATALVAAAAAPALQPRERPLRLLEGDIAYWFNPEDLENEWVSSWPEDMVEFPVGGRPRPVDTAVVNMLTSDLERVMRGCSIVPPAPTPGTPAADSSAAAAAGAGAATAPALTAKQHLNSMAYLAACSQEHPPHVLRRLYSEGWLQPGEGPEVPAGQDPSFDTPYVQPVPPLMYQPMFPDANKPGGRWVDWDKASPALKLAYEAGSDITPAEAYQAANGPGSAWALLGPLPEPTSSAFVNALDDRAYAAAMWQAGRDWRAPASPKTSPSSSSGASHQPDSLVSYKDDLRRTKRHIDVLAARCGTLAREREGLEEALRLVEEEQSSKRQAMGLAGVAGVGEWTGGFQASVTTGAAPTVPAAPAAAQSGSPAGVAVADVPAPTREPWWTVQAPIDGDMAYIHSLLADPANNIKL